MGDANCDLCGVRCFAVPLADGVRRCATCLLRWVVKALESKAQQRLTLDSGEEIGDGGASLL